MDFEHISNEEAAENYFESIEARLRNGGISYCISTPLPIASSPSSALSVSLRPQISVQMRKQWEGEGSPVVEYS